MAGVMPEYQALIVSPLTLVVVPARIGFAVDYDMRPALLGRYLHGFVSVRACRTLPLEDATAELVAGDADLAHCGSSSRPATHGIVDLWERTIAVKRQEVRQWSGLARYETSRGARRVGD